MARAGRPRKTYTIRRMRYDGIELLPVDVRIHPYSSIASRYQDSWHLPGGEIVTTKQLVARAEKRGVPLYLCETSRVSGMQRTRLA